MHFYKQLVYKTTGIRPKRQTCDQRRLHTSTLLKSSWFYSRHTLSKSERPRFLIGWWIVILTESGQPRFIAKLSSCTDHYLFDCCDSATIGLSNLGLSNWGSLPDNPIRQVGLLMRGSIVPHFWQVNPYAGWTKVALNRGCPHSTSKSVHRSRTNCCHPDTSVWIWNKILKFPGMP